MRCDRAREAISARLDHEDLPDDPVALDAHLAACPGCSAYAGAAGRLHRHLRVRAADPVPDMTAEILASTAAVAPRPRPAVAAQRIAWVRSALLFTALAQLALALPELLLGHDHGSAIHVAHEQGSWDVALAVALLAVVWRPVRAAGLLPFVVALTVVLAGTSVVDVAQRHASVVPEAHHLLDVAGIVFLWLLTPGSARLLERTRARIANRLGRHAAPTW